MDQSEQKDLKFNVGDWVEFIKKSSSFHYYTGVIKKILSPDSYEILLYSGDIKVGREHTFRRLSESEAQIMKDRMKDEDVLHVEDVKIGDYVQEKDHPQWHGRIVEINENAIKIRLSNGIYIEKEIRPWGKIYGTSKKLNGIEGEKSEDADFCIDNFYPEAKAVAEQIFFENIFEIEIAEMLFPVLKDMKGFCHETVTADSPWTAGHFVVRLNAGSPLGKKEQWREVLRKINEKNHYAFVYFFVEEYKKIYKEDFYIKVALYKEYRGPGFQ